MPDDPQFFAAVMGALDQLTYENNWVQGTGVTSSAAASAAQEMFNAARESLGACLTGQVVAWTGASIPTGFLECDGSTQLRIDWPNLYAAIDSFFIIDADHFFLPDLRGRSIIGVGSGSGLTLRNMGDTGGEETHVLSTSELASHSHTDTGHTHVESVAAPNITTIGAGAPQATAVPAVGVTGVGNAILSSTGSDAAHNTMHPFEALRYIIQAD